MEWISLKTRKPEPGETVLLSTRQYVFTGTYNPYLPHQWGCCSYSGDYGRDITHWMPLPKPVDPHCHIKKFVSKKIKIWKENGCKLDDLDHVFVDAMLDLGLLGDKK